ncbi:MAG TPA: EthD domain-containing protein [Caulobacter sp.]|nr:EthD domain-containing protein [Caulobacter sp.]
MIKLTFCLTRRPDFTRETFQDYWFNTHAPLVASVRDVLRIRRYVQMHSFPLEVSADTRASRGGPEGYDGVAELWWDSFEDMAATAGDPAAREAGRMLLEDEKRFIDLTRSPLWWGEEREIFSA